jgi:hypothetical protein
MANTYAEAADGLPSDARWSCSFDYPGEGGYCERYRTPCGDVWQISNGSWDLLPFEFDWCCKKLGE